MSTFTWLDYSEHERRQFDAIIKGFNEKGARDELGLGSVRDAFADMLFPGVSTIQTRARYFLFVPWVYQEVERRRERPAAASGRNREIGLINHLARSSDAEGVIGIDARATLKRLRHARNFSESMFGASLLYNLMLAQKAGVADLTDLYRERLQRWAEAIEERRAELSRWHTALPDFWRVATSSGAIIPMGARRFVESWLHCALAPGNMGHIADAEPTRELIHEREHSLKRNLARLDNQRAVKLSRRTVVVLSRDYLESGWSAPENVAAQHLSVEERRVRLLPVIIDETLLDRDRHLNREVPLGLGQLSPLDVTYELSGEENLARLADLLKHPAPAL